MTNATDLLMDLLKIPSPTYEEDKKAAYLKKWCNHNLPNFSLNEIGNNLVYSKINKNKKTLAFVGHTDTVPPFFPPYIKDNKMYGSGASDMQAGIACFLNFVKSNLNKLTQDYSIVIILYDKEEGTPLHENGLNECIKAEIDCIKNIDLAIVAEPTNNAIQLGCVGSIHYTAQVQGKSAHSARPWHGKNALYTALPLIQKIANIEPKKQTIFDVDFYDVFDITESMSSQGRTTVPELWTCNINYRFSPVHTMQEAKNHVESMIAALGIDELTLKLLNEVDAGNVIDHPVLRKAKTFLKVEAKQAWTDVAQLTALDIPAFNFGPGRQEEAHLPNECVYIEDMLIYEKYLKQLLLED